MADAEKHKDEFGDENRTIDDGQKQAKDDSISDVSQRDTIGRDNEIVWHYLTFETELPAPAFQTQTYDPSSATRQPPECPDLRKYTSPFLWSRGQKHFHAW